MIKPIPGTSDLLAIWNYGLTGRTPLNSALSSDGGRTWKNVKLVEQSTFHGYCYTSLTFVNGQVYLTYIHYPSLPHLMRFEADPGYHDLRLVRLPLSWFYRINAHLTVAAEPAGADLRAGDPVRVSWETCEPVGFVDLSLLRGNEVVAPLQAGLVVNTRAYATRLTLPRGLPSGDNYRLLLSDSENPRVSARSEAFRIGR
jgi:hypothetical protein